jgi:hypothetical protein
MYSERCCSGSWRGYAIVGAGAPLVTTDLLAKDAAVLGTFFGAMDVAALPPMVEDFFAGSWFAAEPLAAAAARERMGGRGSVGGIRSTFAGTSISVDTRTFSALVFSGHLECSGDM